MYQTIVAAVGMLFASFALISTVNVVVPKVYMDEIYHVDQLQRYCAGNFTSWNPLITTPPGLYLTSLAIVLPARLVVSDQVAAWLCDVQAVRLFNSLFMALAVVVVAKVQRRIWMLNGVRPGNARTAMVAINIVTFPVLFFSSVLYYTDLLSLVAVLLTLHMLERQSVKSGAVCAAFAMLMRQTNIVWTAFGAGLLVYDRLLTGLQKKTDSEGRNELSLWSVLRRLWWSFRANWWSTLVMVVKCVWTAWPLCVLAMCGVAFVVWNGGIVLGDRTAHTVVFHAPQLFYFFAFSSLCASPLLLSRRVIGQVFDYIRRRPVRLTLSALSALIVIHLFTFDHPYLLSDNRHYTFYLWRRWFMRHWLLKFVPTPVYILAALAMAVGVQRQSTVWRLGFFLATVAVTVPNRLLEFRYFIIPYIIWRLHVDTQLQSWPRLGLEFLFNCAVNIVTIWMFLYRPFVWSHEPDGVQRFMW